MVRNISMEAGGFPTDGPSRMKNFFRRKFPISEGVWWETWMFTSGQASTNKKGMDPEQTDGRRTDAKTGTMFFLWSPVISWPPHWNRNIRRTKQPPSFWPSEHPWWNTWRCESKYTPVFQLSSFCLSWDRPAVSLTWTKSHKLWKSPIWQTFSWETCIICEGSKRSSCSINGRDSSTRWMSALLNWKALSRLSGSGHRMNRWGWKPTGSNGLSESIMTNSGIPQKIFTGWMNSRTSWRKLTRWSLKPWRQKSNHGFWRCRTMPW